MLSVRRDARWASADRVPKSTAAGAAVGAAGAAGTAGAAGAAIILMELTEREGAGMQARGLRHRGDLAHGNGAIASP